MRLISLTILFVYTTLLYANGHLYSKKELSIEDGLSHNGVTSILQDSKGYLWVGTYEGLNRYDGYGCTQFRNTLDKDYFTSNRIRSIYESKTGILWLGTDNGITIYNPEQEQFSKIFAFSDNNDNELGPIVKRVIPTIDNNLLCITEDAGLFLFSQKYELIDTFQMDNPTIFLDGIALDSATFALCSNKGVFLFSLKKGTFTHLFKDVAFANAIFKNEKDKLLYIAKPHGIKIVNYAQVNGQYQFEGRGSFLQEYKFTCGYIDPYDHLWLGIKNEGVLRVKSTKAMLENRELETLHYYDESDITRTSCFLGVDQLGCWVGTFNKGVILLDFEKNAFSQFNTSQKKDNAPKNNSVLSITALDSNRIMMAIENENVSIYNVEKEAFEPLHFTQPQYSNISFVHLDKRGDLWMGAGYIFGIYRLRKGKDKLEHIHHKRIPELSTATLSSVETDKQGNVWLGCDQGVYKCTINKKGDISNVESLNLHATFKEKPITNIRHLYADPTYDFLWVGTNLDGLIRIDLSGNDLMQSSIKQFRSVKGDNTSISSNFVTSIIRTSTLDLWVGTEDGGICQVANSESIPTFKSYTESDGLSNNVVKRILYDNKENLWISTNIGLNRFSLKDYSFKHFNKDDGLSQSIFQYAACKLDNGLFAFGGSQGLCYFLPEKLKKQSSIPTLYFDKLQVQNKTVKPNDTLNGHVILDKSISQQQGIVLKYKESAFSINMSSLHYANPKNYLIRYRLLPINTKWVEVSSDKNYLQLPGLKPGKYTLEAMASNGLNQWSDPISLHIKIRPPWHRSILAFVLYFILLAVFIHVVLMTIFNIKKLKHEVEIETITRINTEENNNAKLRFFSNISHELRTPLTLITAPVEMLLTYSKGDNILQEQLKLVKRQSKKIIGLVEQVHDFQKSDKKLLKMSPVLFEAKSFFQDLETDFLPFAKHQNKTFAINHPAHPIYLNADKDKLEKIFNNLINNAFKFTKDGDSITISYSAKDKILNALVVDTGRGIDSVDLPHVFERFYQSQKNLAQNIGGSGIGLAFSKRLVEMHYGTISVESKIGAGSQFSIDLPIVTDQIPQTIITAEKELLEANNEVCVSQIKQTVKTVSINQENKDLLIFLVEDNDDMRCFIESILSKHYQVVSFQNGKIALNAIEKKWPDMIVSDILMPEVNGLELCNTVKSDIKTSHIPVVLLTACSTTLEQMDGIKNGADAYITKPFNVEHLITHIDALFSNRKAIRERYQMNFQNPQEQNNKEEEIFLEKLYNIFNDNLDNQDLNLDNIARQLYLNRSHFYQKVKALTNQTPYELLKDYRLNRAAELLVNEKLTVSQVYYETGFKSRPHFSKLFKEKFDVSPAKFAMVHDANTSKALY